MSKVTVEIKSLEQAIHSSHELSLYGILHKTIYHKDLGWVDIEMQDNVLRQAIGLAIDALGMKKYTQAFGAMFNIYNAGINVPCINRVHFDIINGVVVCSYCAGQDYRAEVSRLRRAIYAKA